MMTHKELLQDALEEIILAVIAQDEMKESSIERKIGLSMEADAILQDQLKKLVNDYDSQFIGDYVKKYYALMEVALEHYFRHGVPYKKVQ